MNDKLRSYIDSLFMDAPNTKKTYELKEELLSNLNAKYDDLIGQGVPEAEAYKTAIAGIGDVTELISALKRDNVLDYTSMQAERRKSAILTSVAVGLYILSVAILILFSQVFSEEIGIISMFVMDAIATSMLVYNGIAHGSYKKADDSIVEEFKEWKSVHTKNQYLKKTISSILWPLIVVFYFFISFFFDAWAYSWIVFILGVALNQIVSAVIDFKDKPL
jgi:hypothetical protein